MQSEPLGSSRLRDPEPARPELGLWSATALVVGHTIGVGIFLTPAELIGALGSPALTFGLWLACGALVLAGALTFGELARRFPQGGGPYVYLRQAWGAGLRAIPRPRRSSCSSSSPLFFSSPLRGRCRPWPVSPSFCSAFRLTLF